MVDVSAIAGTVSALKGAMDISKALIGLRDAQAIQAKVIELNGRILEAQISALSANEERATLIEQIRKLETELARVKEWDAEKQRYQLKDFGGGTFAYELKPQEARGEPVHRICAQCYSEGKKAILQFTHTSEGQDWYKCYGCKTDIAFGVYTSTFDRQIDYGD